MTFRVDCHAHFFNVLYLPVEGILLRRGLPVEAAVWVGAALRKIARERTDGTRALNDLPAVPREQAHFEALFNQLATAVEPPGGLMDELSGEGDFGIRMWRFVRRLLRGAGSLIRWLTLMTRSESDILDQAEQTFPDVQLFVNHLMELDSFYDLDQSEYDFDTRIKRMGNLGPGVKSFVAFDPSLDAGGLERVKRAFDEGYAGVKVYPPSGYKPWNNATARLYPGLNPQKVDAAFRSLFDLCAAEDKSIFAHCSPVGFEALRNFGLNSHPAGWRDALSESGHPNLRLCLGHAGGTYGWLGTDGVEFVDEALSLCTDFENVYIEFGHFEEILWSRAHRERLREELGQRVPKGSRLEERIMMGSDWHVSAALDDIDGYERAFEYVMSDRSDQAKEGFFGKNALHFLGDN